ncbi:unnamed protein product, partial [Amoebophrya sp. A120]|eukprot:GSA120T00023307001.1
MISTTSNSFISSPPPHLELDQQLVEPETDSDFNAPPVDITRDEVRQLHGNEQIMKLKSRGNDMEPELKNLELDELEALSAILRD